MAKSYRLQIFSEIPADIDEVMAGQDSSALNLFRKHLLTGASFDEMLASTGRQQKNMAVKAAAVRVLTKRIYECIERETPLSTAKNNISLKEYSEEMIFAPARFFGFTKEDICEQAAKSRGADQKTGDVSFALYAKICADSKVRFDEIKSLPSTKPHELAKAYEGLFTDVLKVYEKASTGPQKHALSLLTDTLEPLHEELHEFFMRELNRRRIALTNLRSHESIYALGQLLAYTSQTFGNKDERLIKTREAMLGNTRLMKVLLYNIEVALTTDGTEEHRREATDVYKALYPLTPSSCTQNEIAGLANLRQAQLTLKESHHLS